MPGLVFFKRGTVGRPSPQIHAAIGAAASLAARHDLNLYITALAEFGPHCPASRHWTYNSVGRFCDAVDLRFLPELTPDNRDPLAHLSITILRTAIADLGPGYDVCLEADHVHIEYDPKAPRP